MTRILGFSTLAICFTSSLLAQTLVLPANAVGVEGNTSNPFPLGITAAPWGGIRTQAVYDSSNLTSQGVTGPITITGIRWRVDGGNTASGGTHGTVAVAMGASTIDYSAVTTTWQATTVVYNGPVTVAPGTGSAPGAWYINVPIAPFTYDPTTGNDLIIDTDMTLGTWTGGVAGSHDVSGPGSMSSRIFSSSSYPAANDTTQDHGIVVQLCYAPSFTKFGDGCGGTQGVPELVPVGNSVPKVGTSFTVQCTNAPSGVAFMLVGFSNTVSALGPLPFAVFPIATPNCLVRVSDEAFSLMPIGNPTWTLDLTNNLSPNLCGARLFNQALVLAPGANNINWVLSDAYELRVGQ